MSNGKSEIVFGVDLGTTFSTVAWVNEHGDIQALAGTPVSAKALQSAVFIRGIDDAVVGEDAIHLFRVRPASDTDSCLVTGAKRYLGVDALAQTSRDPTPPYFAWGEEWSPVEISALILKKLALLVEKETGQKLRRIVLTHPHFFMETQKVETRLAAELAGLEVVELMTEPSAAALACLDNDASNGQRVLVFDIGGGTLDISLFETSNGSFQWMGGAGDPTLGGRDFDTALYDYVANEWRMKFGIEHGDTTKAETAISLERKLIFAKFKLQLPEAVQQRIEVGGGDLDRPRQTTHVLIDAEGFDRITGALIARARDLVEKSLQSVRGHWSVDDISRAVIVGGSGRLRAVHRMLGQDLGLPVIAHPNLDTAVARGAALRAHQLSLKASLPSPTPAKVATLIAMDVSAPPLAHSVGVCITDAKGNRVIDWLVAENTPMDKASAEREYGLTLQGASSVAVEIYEGDAGVLGDRPSADLAQRLGSVELSLAAGPRVVLKIGFEQSGLVTVHLRDPQTGKTQQAVLDRTPHVSVPSDAHPATSRSVAEMKQRIARTHVS